MFTVAFAVVVVFEMVEFCLASRIWYEAWSIRGLSPGLNQSRVGTCLATIAKAIFEFVGLIEMGDVLVFSHVARQWLVITSCRAFCLQKAKI
jgi:hypothetical protein